MAIGLSTSGHSVQPMGADHFPGAGPLTQGFASALDSQYIGGALGRSFFGEAILDYRIYLTKTQTKYRQRDLILRRSWETGGGCKIGVVETVMLTFGIGRLLPQNCIYVQEVGDIEYRATNNSE